MERSTTEQNPRKQALTAYLITAGVLILLYAAVCTPIYLRVANDVLLSESVIPILLDLVMTVCNYLIYWVSFAFLIVSVYRDSARGVILPSLCFLGITLLRYCANLFPGYLTDGFPTAAYFFDNTFPYLLADVGMDLALFGIVLLIVLLLGRKDAAGASFPRKLSDALPFARTLSLASTLQKQAFFAAAVPSLLQLCFRVRYDVLYGAPRNLPDLVLMIAYYLSDLLFLLLGFLAILAILNFCGAREGKSR